MQKLDRQIKVEIDKKEPDLQSLVQQMKERRVEIALNHKEETKKKVGTLC